MSRYMVDVDDKIIHDTITNILNTAIDAEMKNRYSQTGDVIAAAVKELIYSRKDEIVELAVQRASEAIARKGLPKLLEKIEV